MDLARILASRPSFLCRSLVPLELLFGGRECCREVLLLPRCCATFRPDSSRDFVRLRPHHLWILLFPCRPLLLEEPVVGRNSPLLHLRFYFRFCFNQIFCFVLSLHYGRFLPKLNPSYLAQPGRYLITGRPSMTRGRTSPIFSAFSSSDSGVPFS